MEDDQHAHERSSAKAKQFLAALLTALTLLSVTSLALTQEDSGASQTSGDPLMLGLAAARDVVEEAHTGD